MERNNLSSSKATFHDIKGLKFVNLCQKSFSQLIHSYLKRCKKIF